MTTENQIIAETPSEFTIKIFSNKKTSVYIPDLNRSYDGRVDIDFVDAYNRAKASFRKFLKMEQFPTCLVIAGNERSNGMASEVSYALKREFGYKCSPANQTNKWGNDLFSMEFTREMDLDE